MSDVPPVGREALIRDLGERVRHGDAAALGELAQHLLPILARRLRRAYRRVSSDVLSDACEDAILDYGASPHRFDPTRGVPLDRFLQMMAARNVADLLKADARRRQRDANHLAHQQSTPRVQMIVEAEDEGDARQRILSVAAVETLRGGPGVTKPRARGRTLGRSSN